MVDRDLANHDADLAAKVQVIPGLDVRLAYIDTSTREDNYHVLQGLKDPTLGGDANCCFFYERWGGTGTRGEMKVEGPEPQTSVAKRVANVFKEKTGAEWGALKEGDRALPGKFWVQHHGSPDLTAKWEYYVSDGVDGKRTGWYPYDPRASDEVEEIYSQHVANARESRTATRFISSGYFQYRVDLTKMTQTNTRTNKVRTIRRSAGEDAGSEDPPARRAMKAMKAMRRAPSADAGSEDPPARVAMKSMKAMRVVPSADPPARTAMKSMKRTAMRVAAMKVSTRSKAMKVSIMKVMKSMKKTSKVGTKSQVLKGKRLKTKGGMKASDLIKSKSGKVVSKKKSELGKKAYQKNLAKWAAAVSKARTELGLKGFVAIKKDSELYNRAKALMSS